MHSAGRANEPDTDRSLCLASALHGVGVRQYRTM